MTSMAPGRSRPSAHARAITAVLTLACAVLLLVVPRGALAATRARTAPASRPTAGTLAPALARLAAAHPTRRVDVIVQLTSGTPIADGRALVRAAGGRPGVSLSIIDGLSARLPAAGARRLAASSRVHAVTPNAQLHNQSYASPQVPSQSALATNVDSSVNATNLWSNSTGEGVGVAVIDTGIDGDLPDFLGNDGQSRVVASAVIDPNATSADDTYGHGTAVAGLIAGNGDQLDPSDPEWGQYVGTAPNANLISIKIADDSGNSTVLDAIYGLQFAVDHQNQYNIRVINMSFRSTTAESYTTDPLDAAAEQAWMHGIVVVAAAGNLGSAPDAVSHAPANDPYVITVGATDTNGTTTDSDDTVPSWSSEGTTQDGFAKPDVLAPGDDVVTTLAPGSDFASECPSCIVGSDGDYFQLSGTSLAAPIVSGIAADLIGDHPDWSPDQVKGAIVDSATPLSGGGSEVNGAAADADANAPLADQGLTPSTMIDPSTGDINYSAASWSAASWSAAAAPDAASWSAASWSCLDCGAADGDQSSGSGSGSGGVATPGAASWSGGSTAGSGTSGGATPGAASWSGGSGSGSGSTGATPAAASWSGLGWASLLN